MRGFGADESWHAALTKETIGVCIGRRWTSHCIGLGCGDECGSALRGGCPVKIGSLFSGIGGLELGLEMAGLGHTIWQVEQSEFCRSVLSHHWPDAGRYKDVREVGAASLAPVELICGGFPCQDTSSAGKGAGLAGDRSGLWFEFARVIGEMRPQWAVVENVASGARRWVDAVCSGLGQLGYETLPVPISAQAVGAPHRRERVFIIAHAICEPIREQSRRSRGPGRQGPILTGQLSEARPVAHADGEGESALPVHEQMGRVSEPATHCGWRGGPPVSPICGVDDGVPRRMDRLRALGNAVVPQCAEVVGWMIRELMETRGGYTDHRRK